MDVLNKLTIVRAPVALVMGWAKRQYRDSTITSLGMAGCDVDSPFHHD